MVKGDFLRLEPRALDTRHRRLERVGQLGGRHSGFCPPGQDLLPLGVDRLGRLLHDILVVRLGGFDCPQGE